MMEGLQNWWRERTPRERGLLALLMLIAVPVLLLYGVMRPLDRILERAQLARDAEARTLADMILMANRIAHAPRAARTGQPIDVQIRSEAERAGFTVGGVARDGEGAILTIDAVRSEPFFGWIAKVRGRGVIVTRLTARPNGDSTLSVSARFERAR